jgi:hypothetical protein
LLLREAPPHGRIEAPPHARIEAPRLVEFEKQGKGRGGDGRISVKGRGKEGRRRRRNFIGEERERGGTEKRGFTRVLVWALSF